MDEKRINQERFLGKAEMAINIFKSNEKQMKKSGFGMGLDWEDVAEWMLCSKQQLEEIQTMCYMLSERGVRDAVQTDALNGTIAWSLLDNPDAKNALYLFKLRDNAKYIEDKYPYLKELVPLATDFDFALDLASWQNEQLERAKNREEN